METLQNPPDYRSDTVLPLNPAVSANAWAVDGACSGNPGQMEYRGVDLATGQTVFHFGPILATNNIGEFLAIVHALALMERQGISKTIYTDSVSGLAWVRTGKCKTQLRRDASTERAWQMVERGEKWLQTHSFRVPIVQWETRLWGENPADFGRKK